MAKGSKEHFEVLALRQKWTLPLDDGDYKLWMHSHLLEQHGGALAEEATHRRIEKAKAVARGPVIAIAVLGLVAVVAGAGWWLGRGASGEASAPAATAGPRADTAAVAPTVVAAPRAALPGAAPPETATPAATGREPAAGAAGASAVPAGPSAAPAKAASAATPPAAKTSAPAAPRPAGSGGKDIWEREF